MLFLLSILLILFFIILQLDFKPADVKHSSLHTMANKVRHAMLPNNHDVSKKSLAEGEAQL